LRKYRARVEHFFARLRKFRCITWNIHRKEFVDLQFNFLMHMCAFEWDYKGSNPYRMTRLDRPSIAADGPSCECQWGMFQGTPAQAKLRIEYFYRELVSRSLVADEVRVICQRSAKCAKGRAKEYISVGKKEQRKQFLAASARQRERAQATSAERKRAFLEAGRRRLLPAAPRRRGRKPRAPVEPPSSDSDSDAA
jgi:hypothetical protein